jgi:hypothetical protein
VREGSAHALRQLIEEFEEANPSTLAKARSAQRDEVKGRENAQQSARCAAPSRPWPRDATKDERGERRHVCVSVSETDICKSEHLCVTRGQTQSIHAFTSCRCYP